MLRPELPMFRKEGVLWAVTYQRKLFRLPASKGLGHLSRLVAAPGSRVRASDLAGRSAGPGDGRIAEQDRVNVTKGIKAAIKKIAERNPALGLHLEQGIRTGAFCCYAPLLPSILIDREPPAEHALSRPSAERAMEGALRRRRDCAPRKVE